jgi:hypothetical protein
MSPSPNQQRRLLGLLDQLVKIKNGDPAAMQESSERSARLDFAGFDGPEHREIVVLFNAGYITSHSFFGISPANHWSSEGIYAYDITEDGEEYLAANRHLLGARCLKSNVTDRQRRRPP